ncbi:hypothetical protein [Rothia sp. 88186D007BW]
MNKRVQNKWWIPASIAGLGVVSLIVAGLEYRNWEESGEPYHQASSWIIAWHGLSLLVIVISILVLIWQFLKLQKK